MEAITSQLVLRYVRRFLNHLPHKETMTHVRLLILLGQTSWMRNGLGMRQLVPLLLVGKGDQLNLWSLGVGRDQRMRRRQSQPASTPPDWTPWTQRSMRAAREPRRLGQRSRPPQPQVLNDDWSTLVWRNLICICNQEMFIDITQKFLILYMYTASVKILLATPCCYK